MITYNKIDKFLLVLVDFLNPPLKKKNNNNYHIGGYLYEDIKEFIFISAQCSNFRIRITFLEKPTNNLEFIIHSRYSLLNKEYRNKILKSTIITKSNIYMNGLCNLLENL